MLNHRPPRADGVTGSGALSVNMSIEPTPPPSDDDPGNDLAETSSRHIKSRLEVAQREIKLLRQADEALGLFIAARSQRCPVAASDALETNRNVLELLAPDLLELFASDVRAEAERVVDDAHDLLLAELGHAKVELDPTSRFPRFSTDGRFVELIADTRKRKAKIQARDGKPITIPLDPAAAVGALVAEQRRVFTPLQTERGFLGLLRDSFRVVASNNVAVITDVREHFLKNNKAFDGSLFNVHLARIARAGTRTADGLHLSLEHTKNTDRGILLWQGETAGYVGHVRFVKGAPL